MLHSDQPVDHPDNDELGYAPFAKHLAKSLRSMAPLEGFVISLNGSWGSGKSTILNFVSHYIAEAEEQDRIPEDERAIWFRFNPWWFSGREDLTLSFFDQMQEQVGSKIKDIKDHISKLGYAASKIPTEYLSLVPYGSLAEPAVKKLIGLMQDSGTTSDVLSLKEKISDELKKSDRKIIVVIDDIDRLTSSEIQTLFRTIKAIADFPNVIYLLAYDRKVVENALGRSFSERGSDYIDKIVQVPFTLPAPNQNKLQRLFTSQVKDLLERTEPYYFDSERWGRVHPRGLQPLLQTPRMITRVLNALQVTYPAVAEDVNAVDFVAVEVIRILAPDLYDHIRSNRTLVTQAREYSSTVGGIARLDAMLGKEHMEEQEEEKKAILDRWLDEIDANQEAIKMLLSNLFPRFAGHYTYWQGDLDEDDQWERERRICSPDFFHLYFRLSLSDAQVSAEELDEIIAATERKNDLVEKLRGQLGVTLSDGGPRLKLVLDRLREIVEDRIPEQNIPVVIESLLSVGDELLEIDQAKPAPLTFSYIHKRIYSIIDAGLRRVEDTRRKKILYSEIDEGTAIATIAHVMTQLEAQHGRHGSRAVSNPLFPEDEVDEMVNSALSKIQQAASDGELLGRPALELVLHLWKEWGSVDEVKEWVAEATENDKALADFVLSFMRHPIIHRGTVTVTHRVDPRDIDPFVESKTIIDRIRSVKSDSSLTEQQRIALSQFKKEYDLIESGKDPDHEL